MLPEDRKSDKCQNSAQAEQERLDQDRKMAELKAREAAALERQAADATRVQELELERAQLTKNKKEKE